ncbi:MAG: D-lyxose/D-mannose family sugar isomerase, partial [Spirochaetia bacterium]|nr:D-lyxose/D-mannose family sugar isomerase [Spirochaetia bacterium]
KLVLELHASTKDGALSKDSFSVRIDGIEKTLRGGDQVVLGPGESICLPTGLYHRFWGEGKTLVGEVSMANDDATDNRFLESIGRFPAIDEDAEPRHLLVTDYPRFF